MQIIRILLIFAFGIVLGWYLHLYSAGSGLAVESSIKKPKMETEAKSLPETPTLIHTGRDRNSSRTVSISTPVPAPSPVKKMLSLFGTKLEKDQFDEAMELYMDADEKDISAYQKVLIDHFNAEIKTSPDRSAEEILQYLDVEPDSREVQYLLVHLYMQEKTYPKAIDLIIAMKENYLNEADDKKLDTLLKISAESYIGTMKKRKDFAVLTAFLEQMMAYGFSVNYYAFELAKLDFDLQKYNESRTLLLQLKEDAVYDRKSQNLLDKIEKLEEAAQEYEYKIPLQRRGRHFSVEVTVNGAITLHLLLDTGATYTMVSAGKIPSLSILKREVKLGTAGGNISADLCLANTFSLGDIELQNFRIMVAPFEQKGVDGLLGMNFFQKFKFFIDQKASLLYLSTKARIPK